MRRLDRSRDLWERAEKVIPLGTQTLSKGPTQFVQGVSPIYLQRGKGAHVWDVDGNEYIDYPMALGPVILGHAEDVVDDAIRKQLRDGITFTLMHPLEVEVAEKIVDLCPGVEAVRFAKSGSDALSAAVRIARAYTGREHVLVSGYHGWHDWYIGSTDRNAGVPKAVSHLIGSFRFNDLEDLDRALAEKRGSVAAICVEPASRLTPEEGFLQSVVERARSEGAVSIFDEVITGFRIAVGGARERYSVIPDISCYGKALGNGMPISAVGGSRHVMRSLERVFFSGTHGGETLSLAAALAVLTTLGDGTVLRKITETGRRILDGISYLIKKYEIGERVQVGGEPQCPFVTFPGADSSVVKSWVQQCLIERGILFNGAMFICARHSTEDVDRTLQAFREAFSVAASREDLSDRLKGAPIRSIFSPR